MKKNINEMIKKFADILLFQKFKSQHEELKKIALITEPVFFKKNEKIIVEGEPGDCLYILKAGNVLITKKTFDDDEYILIPKWFQDFLTVSTLF